MSDIEGPREGPSAPSPQDVKLYKQEYHHGVDLFQRAMEEYGKADEIHKKEAFREVMDRALHVLNDVAYALKNPQMAQQNEKIAEDFQAYQDKGDEVSKNQLAQDLRQAKKFG